MGLESPPEWVYWPAILMETTATRMSDNKDDTEDIGAALQRWRKSKGWTRKRAAEHFGVSERSIENWEFGYRKPDSLKLLDALWGTRRTK